MNILLPPTFIIDCLTERFEDFRESGDEFMINSPFFDDSKYHLSINTQTGLWQDFVTGNKGNLISLLSKIDGITYREAAQKVLSSNRVASLKNLEDLLDGQLKNYMKAAITVTPKNSLPSERLSQLVAHEYGFQKIDTVSMLSDPLALACAKYLRGRGINFNRFFYSTKGEFVGRLIVPLQNGSEYPYNFIGIDVSGKCKTKHKRFGKRHLEKLSPDLVGLVHFKKTSSYVPAYPKQYNEVTMIFESSLDAICIADTFGFRTIALNGTDLPEEEIKYTHLDINSVYKSRVYVCLDADIPGIEASLRISKTIHGTRYSYPSLKFYENIKNNKDIGDYVKSLNLGFGNANLKLGLSKLFEKDTFIPGDKYKSEYAKIRAFIAQSRGI
jgi:hypothetical protein